MTRKHTRSSDVVVVGAGMAGLALAAQLGRAGLRVRVFDKAAAVGGRARTTVRGDYALNMGPHALYRRGHARALLDELDVSFSGAPAPARGAAIRGGQTHMLPVSPISLLSTRLLGFGEKLELAGLMQRLPQMDAAPLDPVSVSDWLGRALRHPATRDVVEAVIRLSTYANAPGELSAGTAVRQLKLALGGVLYVDDGWAALVEGLHRSATFAGVDVVTEAGVVDLRKDRNGRFEVDARDGSTTAARFVVFASAPTVAARLIARAGGAPPKSMKHCEPVRAATLDIALDHLPRPDRTFALGIDEPLYLSVHSSTARLAPEGGAVIHVAKYLPPTQTDPSDDRRQIDALLDRVQPGWRDVACEERFLPHLTVAERLDRAMDGGPNGRPAPDSVGLAGVYAVGDWVQSDGWIADAALASTRPVARDIIERATAAEAA